MNPLGLKILIPLDGSSTSEAILPALKTLIQSHPSELTLLHIADSSDNERASAIRLEVVRQAFEAEGGSVRLLLRSGKPAAEIVEVATPGRFDLIAMGTHGRTCMDRIIMGSVAEEVIRTSRVPVLLARPDCRTGPWDTMLVALDGTPGGEGILEDVIRLARALKASVHLVCVDAPDRWGGDFADSKTEFPRAGTLTYLKTIAGRFQEQGIPARIAPLQGEPADEITRLARFLGAGVICMATEGRSASSPGIGNSTTAEVIGKAPCAVYVGHRSRIPELRREKA